MTHIFRTRRQIWLTEVVGPAVFVTGIVLALAVWGNAHPQQLYLLLGMWIVAALVVLRRDALPRWRNSVVLDNQAISGQIAKQTFHVPWSDILAISLDGTGEDQHLSLATAQQTITIPVYEFDAAHIWQLVQTYARPEALADDAYKHLPGYAEWAATAARLISEEYTTLRATMPVLTAIGVGTIVLFLGVSLAVWWAGQGMIAPFFLLFAALGLVLLLIVGPVELDPEGISYRTALGWYRITWAEVRRVETDFQWQTLVLIGDDKQLALPGPPWWAGANKEQMVHILHGHIEQRQIPIEQTSAAMYKMSRNAKVR